MVYKVGLLGASGRMGQEVAALLKDGFTLGHDVFEPADGERTDVWIDFSHPQATVASLKQIDRPIVIATTGFTSAQVEEIKVFGRKTPCLLCPNTSAGMRVMHQMLQVAQPLAAQGFVAVVEEEHHKHKKDSPSGTAKLLLEALEKSGFSAPRIHVTRAGSTIGVHRVRLIAQGEELSITHRVTDRRIFARGALWGAQFLLRRKTPRVYRFEEVEGTIDAMENRG